AQAVQLGVDGGLPLRIEVTLMPETRTIEWEGRQVETLVSQFVSYRDGRILEVAYDYFAQADDGSVWYFGEEVDNYSDGRIANHSGAWLAGEDGPPGMIMPANPQEGDRFRPENIPGLVFEEVTVLETDVTTDGPSGAVTGAIRVEEHLMDGDTEQKIWAPGYGEFRTEAASELVTMAIAVPTDAAVADATAELARITDGALLAFDAASAEDWAAVADEIDVISGAWEAISEDPMPPLLAEQMTNALADLTTGADDQDADAARQAALDTALAAVDLELQHRDPTVIDLERMGVWALRLVADADTSAAVRGDVATLETIWDRVRHAVGPAEAEAVDEHLLAARTAADADDIDAAVAAAEAVRAPLEAALGHVE
ncbi:MAG: hypothetical protein M3537_00430, partial [Chloroflexota bacterium]|nr:hypothetical protein [Chloroflexota bacterium]